MKCGHVTIPTPDDDDPCFGEDFCADPIDSSVWAVPSWIGSTSVGVGKLFGSKLTLVCSCLWLLN